MGKKAVRIGIVAPSSPFSRDTALRVSALTATLFPASRLRLDFHPQCFLRHNHFAGDDAARTQAFVDYANDGDYDAVWFARGGYGACRIVDPVIDKYLDYQAKHRVAMVIGRSPTFLCQLNSNMICDQCEVVNLGI